METSCAKFIIYFIWMLFDCALGEIVATTGGGTETDGSTTMLFHSVLYYPSEISLKRKGKEN